MREDIVTERRRDRVMSALSDRMGSVVAVAEAVHRRHNSSAILRSCEAFGVHEVHLIHEGFSASPGAARGAERWVHTRSFPSTEESLSELQSRGFHIYVADFIEPHWIPEEVPVDHPIAVVFGSEARGVTDQARRFARGAITIPMRGLTASLNVSVSAALILRTVADRRRALVGPDLSEVERKRFYDAWLADEITAHKGLLRRTSEDGL